MAIQNRVKQNQLMYAAPNPAMLSTQWSAGITKVDPSKPISVVDPTGSLNFVNQTQITLNKLNLAVPGSANLGIGEKIMTFPKGVILPIAAMMRLTVQTQANVAITSGQLGLGTVVASGAVNVLTGTATFNNILGAKTLAAQAQSLSTIANAFGAAGATEGTMAALDGSVTPVPVFANIAAAFTQAGALPVIVSGLITIQWLYLGPGV